MNRLLTVGLLINAACIVTDRFIVELPSMIAIPVLVAGIACLVTGSVQMKKKDMRINMKPRQTLYPAG